MASALPPRPPRPYDGQEESTPTHISIPERLARVETRLERQEREVGGVAAELREVANELREVAHAVRSLTERRKFFDKVVLAAASLVATGLLLALLRLSYWVQTAKLP